MRLGRPVLWSYLGIVLDDSKQYVVLAGKAELQRRAILKLRPNVRSWRRLIENCRKPLENEQLMAKAS